MPEWRGVGAILAFDRIVDGDQDRTHDGQERDETEKSASPTLRSRHVRLAITSETKGRINQCPPATMSNSLPSGSANVTHWAPDSS
jgi:hypothetical protein